MKVFNIVFGSFFRTLGRILCYLLLGGLLAFILFKNDVFASSINVFNTADGYVLIDNSPLNYNMFYVTANKDIDFRLMTGTALSVSDEYSFGFIDICSTWEIWGYRYSAPGSSCTNSCINNEVSVQKTKYVCSSGGFQGNIYRLSYSILKWEKNSGEEMGYVSDRISIGTSAGHVVPLTIYGVYFSTDSDLSKFEVDYTDAINNINSSISNGAGSIVNNQDKNQSQTNDRLDSIKDQNQNNHDETMDYITDDTAPNTDISSLGNVQGLLPAGPVDSLLNIPFMFLSVVTTSFGGVCKPIKGTFIFDSTLEIPCFSEMFYDDVPDSLMIFLNLIPSAFILIQYFKHLYKKVDRAVSMNSNADDEWGVI